MGKWSRVQRFCNKIYWICSPDSSWLLIVAGGSISNILWSVLGFRGRIFYFIFPYYYGWQRIYINICFKSLGSGVKCPISLALTSCFSSSIKDQELFEFLYPIKIRTIRVHDNKMSNSLMVMTEVQSSSRFHRILLLNDKCGIIYRQATSPSKNILSSVLFSNPSNFLKPQPIFIRSLSSMLHWFQSGNLSLNSENQVHKLRNSQKPVNGVHWYYWYHFLSPI